MHEQTDTSSSQPSHDGHANVLAVRDRRTGETHDLPIAEGAIRALDLRAFKTDPDDFGLMAFDPGFTNTAACHSAITYIDGERGILEYRGYPIQQLAQQSTFEETAYLLINGELPSSGELREWNEDLRGRMDVPDSFEDFFRTFPPEAHPMTMLQAAVGALGPHYPDAANVTDEAVRREHCLNLVAKTPTLAAMAYRRKIGADPVRPDRHLGFAANVLRMMFQGQNRNCEHPVLVRALDILFILHADHEQNCSTNAVRGVASAQADPYASMSAGVAALSGPLHGGANEAVLRMLREIGSQQRIPAFVDEVKAGHGRLMGFGHRVYKTYDPRAEIIKETADRVFAVTGTNPLLDMAIELEQIALGDQYFVKRRLYPNVDFYSGLIYESLGLPVGMFPVMFAVARTSGWVAHFLEQAVDPERKIARPLQIYVGERDRSLDPSHQAAQLEGAPLG
ncbi:MAG TPA: citrate synthase [Chloroflexota bacterium]|nr:citrate synthase [Chloroflexota bacterium]